MIVKQLTEHHLEFLSLEGGCRGSFESVPVKMPHCWKSHAMALFISNADIKNMILHERSCLLSLVNELGKRDKMRGLPSILSLFRNEFDKFNNTGARMLDDNKIT